jgi:hypothetical protein
MYLAHALRACNRKIETSWFPSTTFIPNAGVFSCIDSSGNTYSTLVYGNTSYVSKVAISGAILWTKAVGSSGFSIANAFIAISPDSNTLYIARDTYRFNGADHCIELHSISSSTGAIISQGYAYYPNNLYTEIVDFKYSENALSSYNLVFTIGGNQAADYPSIYAATLFFVNPSNFTDTRRSAAFIDGTTNSVSAISSDVTYGNGYSYMAVNGSVNGYGIVGTNLSGNAIGSIRTSTNYQISTVATGTGLAFFWFNFLPSQGSIGVCKVSSAFAKQWTTAITITGATTTNMYYQEKNVAVDSSGNSYCAACMKDATGFYYSVIFKVNTSGAVQWVKKFASTVGDFRIISISANSNYLSVSGIFKSTPYSFGMSLKSDGSNTNGTYTGNATVGNITISSPSYTTQTSFTTTSFTYTQTTQQTFNTVTQLTNVTSTTASNTVVPVNLPVS